ncbi:hypothetical protein BKA57DRAFT_317201 [Linnemannia elongata]|nr:hypothetical protein BKA57DRAFT_317201 [Linnemannia elongata]
MHEGATSHVPPLSIQPSIFSFPCALIFVRFSFPFPFPISLLSFLSLLFFNPPPSFLTPIHILFALPSLSPHPPSSRPAFTLSLLFSLFSFLFPLLLFFSHSFFFYPFLCPLLLPPSLSFYLPLSLSSLSPIPCICFFSDIFSPLPSHP